MLIPRSLRFRFLKLYHGSLFCIHFPAMTSIRSFFWQREFRWAQRRAEKPTRMSVSGAVVKDDNLHRRPSEHR